MATIRRPERPAVSPWPFAAMAAMAAIGFLYAASGMFAPWWAVVGLLALWLVLLVVALRWWTPRPRLVAAVPVAALLLWFAVLLLGHLALGWSA